MTEQVRNIRTQLDNAGIGFHQSPRFSGLLGPNPFQTTAREWQTLLDSGQATWDWLVATNQLYCRALKGDDSLQFVQQLVEGESDPKVIELNRQVALSGRLRPACFVRLDQSAIGQAVEAQIPGTGWGYRYALAQAFPGYAHPDFVREFVQAVRIITGRHNPRVFYVVHRDDRFWNEASYFASQVRKAGIDYQVLVRELPKPGDADLIIRYYVSDFMAYPGVEQIIKAYLAGDLEIDPPLNLITDQKVGMILPFDPRTASAYPDQVRSLFPQTRLVGPGDVQAVMDKPTKQRTYILKYAGLLPGMRAFGSAVYNLSQCSRKRALELAKQIHESGSPWILQQLIRQKFNILGEQEPGGELAEQSLYARITPTFALTSHGARLMGCTANFRKEWKVSSRQDAVLLPVVAEQRSPAWKTATGNLMQARFAS